MPPQVQHLVVDTNAFINSAPIKDIGENVYTIQEVIDEVTCKRQLRHLSVLSYDLIVKDVFTENIKFVTEFSKKTGDYPSLSAVDIKVIALTYQLEKEKVGTSHLNTIPTVQKDVNTYNSKPNETKQGIGFFLPVDEDTKTVNAKESSVENKVIVDDDELTEQECKDLELKLAAMRVDHNDENADLLVPVNDVCEAEAEQTVEEFEDFEEEEEEDDGDDEEDDDEDDWITVDNLEQMKKKMDAGLYIEDKSAVACVTADFAMQNVLKQIGLKVSSYDGRLIRKVRTFILRCTTCFKTTSVMTKQFCPNCGHTSLKKVSVSLDENGKQQIFINLRRPLTSRGKRFTLPAPKGGAHAQNPILNADQAWSRSKPTKLARTKNNPLNPDYIAGYSAFVMRDVNSKSAVLGIRNNNEIKNWMRKNPNEVRRRRK
ncbi:RNA-binding protein NOB1 [Arctopsyche grandis]|uniref:RNA-binding protein NOB1 n=1 Tax=Arctopsyche grandis TaxID=121162 RepID=UPI00406D8680